MKTIKFLLIAMVAVLFASCAGTNYSLPRHNLPETKLILQDGNYHIVGQVEGEFSATYILGCGGLSKKALTTNALTEMYKNANLTGNQQIINVTTTVSVESWFIFYRKYRVIAHGYIIEFDK